MVNNILTIFANLTFKDILDIVVKLIGLPTAIAGVVTLIIRLANSQKDKRKEAFKNRLAKVEKVRSTSTIENEKIYKNDERYKDKLAKSYGLIIDKKWVVYDQNKIRNINDLFLLSDIKIKIEKLDKPIEIPSLKIYPNYKKFSKNKEEQTFVYNFLKYNEKNVYLFNGKLFAAKDIVRDGDKIKFIVHQTDYYHFLNSCKALELLYETNERQQKFKMDVLNLTNRYVGIGINCLTIIKNVRKRTNPKEKRDYFLIHSRSSNIIESPNKVHVVPAGSYQPITSIDKINKINDEVKEFNSNMTNTIYREFCEEILSTNHMNEINSYRLLSMSNDYQFCQKFLKVYYLGCGLEPYNTKMEILALGIIDIDEILKERNSEIITRFIDEHKVINNTINNLKENEKIDDKINLDLLSSIISRKDELLQYMNLEGDIKFEKLSKEMFEQYYSDNHSTPSAKEIFGFMYENYDKILK